MLTRNALWAAIAAAAAVLMSAGASAAEIKGAAYADLGYGVENTYVKGAGADTVFGNHGSYWGFKGSTTANGLTAFGAFEHWLSVDSQDRGASTAFDDVFGPFAVPGQNVDLLRQAYAGLATGYGTVKFGTFTTAYAEAGAKLDPFRGTGVAGASFASTGVSHGQSALSGDRLAQGPIFQEGALLNGFPPVYTAPLQGGVVGNQLAYTSPTVFGLTANAAVMFDEGSSNVVDPTTGAPTPQGRQEDFAAGIEWSGMGISAGAQYLDANSNVGNTGLAKRENATRLFGGYSLQGFGANVSAERIDHKAGANDSDYAQVNAWFGVMPNCRIAASYGMENETGHEGTSFRVGVFHDVLENFTVNVTYLNFDGKVENGGAQDNSDAQIISLGASYRFEIGASTTTH